MDQWIADDPEWGRGHILSMLFASFAALALVLAATGLYSVVSYGVTQRSNEFGIRMAVGAQRQDVLWLVFSSTAITLSTGLIAGGLLSLGFNKVLGQLVQGAASDPALLLAAMTFLAAVCATACLLPARRASLIDPMLALRHE